MRMVPFILVICEARYPVIAGEAGKKLGKYSELLHSSLIAVSLQSLIRSVELLNNTFHKFMSKSSKKQSNLTIFLFKQVSYAMLIKVQSLVSSLSLPKMSKSQIRRSQVKSLQDLLFTSHTHFFRTPSFVQVHQT